MYSSECVFIYLSMPFHYFHVAQVRNTHEISMLSTLLQWYSGLRDLFFSSRFACVVEILFSICSHGGNIIIDLLASPLSRPPLPQLFPFLG